MLDLEMLKAMPAHCIFATGEIIDSPEGINMSNSGKMMRWVAVRGVTHDWAIYIHFAVMTISEIAGGGDKIRTKEYIQKLVPCDDEALKMYRR